MKQCNDACNFVIFGGNGDLSIRKLMPALYFLDRGEHLAEGAMIIGASRSQLSKETFQEMVQQGLKEHISSEYLDQEVWQRFSDRLDYVSVDAADEASFRNLRNALCDCESCSNSIFYLSTAPRLFGPISRGLKSAGLISGQSRVVLEKPIGRDFDSSVVINDSVAEVFEEDNIYRIDHYLGKETVQNLLALRFANALFEPVWTNEHIDNVQITVAETVGVEGRWGYYDDSGALRDMVQNHLLQLLCLVAMGVPVSLDQDAVRAEKIKVLKSLKIMSAEEVQKNAIRGQYKAGQQGGQAVPGYREEEGGKKESDTETFVAIRADIHNWRWRGVPFYLRTGKRLPARYSEIVIEFKSVPHSIFSDTPSLDTNKLVIRLQPDESLQLLMQNKVPGIGQGMEVHPVALHLDSGEENDGKRIPEAYERLLFDIMNGSSTLFVHRSEVEAAWNWCDAILEGWGQSGAKPDSYEAGTWGPEAAGQLLARSGRSWYVRK